MSKDLVKKEVTKAEKAFTDVTASCIIFLNKNGLRIEEIKSLLHKTVDKTALTVEEILDKERKEI